MNYFRLKPIERVKFGYLTWDENYTIQFPFSISNKAERWVKVYWYSILGLYRWIASKVLTFDGLLKDHKKLSRDLCQLGASRYYDYNKGNGQG